MRKKSGKKMDEGLDFALAARLFCCVSPMTIDGVDDALTAFPFSCVPPMTIKNEHKGILCSVFLNVLNMCR